MGGYSNLEDSGVNSGAAAPGMPELALGALVVHDHSGEQLRFPAEDEGQSLAAIARQDLQLTLQLLAERAQYITAASGAAIALREGDQMLCAASAGLCAPEQGSELQVNTGLTAESVRSRQVLRCDDAEHDDRVNRDSCRTLGIVSLMVVPLLRDDEVIGVFELLADRPHAFEERDVIALQRLSEMILTAIDHSEAAENASEALIAEETQFAEQISEALASTAPAQAQIDSATANISSCAACGFPVSQGRTLCVDCENAGRQAPPKENPSFLNPLSSEEKSWWVSPYGIGSLLVAAATLAFLLFYLR